MENYIIVTNKLYKGCKATMVLAINAIQLTWQPVKTNWSCWFICWLPHDHYPILGYTISHQLQIKNGGHHANCTSEKASMDYELDQETKMIKTAVAEFSKKELAPNAAETDRSHIFPKTAWNKLSKLDCMGLLTAEKYGGLSYGYDAMVGVME